MVHAPDACSCFFEDFFSACGLKVLLENCNQYHVTKSNAVIVTGPRRRKDGGRIRPF